MSSPETIEIDPAPKPSCNKWLNTNVHVGFAAAIRKAGLKIRKAHRQVIYADQSLAEGPAIEVFHENAWILFVMPDGTKVFPSEPERDTAFDALPGVKE